MSVPAGGDRPPRVVPAAPVRQRLTVAIPGFSTLARDEVPNGDSADIAWRRDRLGARAQPLIAGALGIMLVLSSFFRLKPLSPGQGLVSAAISGITGAALLVAAVALARRRDEQGAPHSATLAVLLVATVALCAVMLVSNGLAQTAYVELVVVIAGSALMPTGSYVLALGGIWALWLGVAAALSGTTDAAGWMLAMIGASVVSVVVQTMRTDALRALGGALDAAREQSVRDPVSGLLSRRGLDVVGTEVLALARRAREPVACTVIAVDGFDDVTDRFGRETADDVVTVMAEALRGVFRQADVVARWDGAEFVVLAMGAGPRDEEVERRLMERVSFADALRVEPGGGLAPPWSVTVSAGRVVHMPWQEEAVSDIAGRARAELDRRRRVRRARSGDQEVPR